jgi:hypothetical protein
MDNATTEKKGFLQNDRLLVCSMLVFYGLCVLGCVGAVFWGLNSANQTISANATSIASVNATEQAGGTATAVARVTEQGQYEFIERFDEASARWYVGPSAKQYGEALYSIKNGVYVWDVRKSDQFIFSVNFYKSNNIKDFDVYLDSKFVKSSKVGAVCTGLATLKTKNNWRDGEFVFTLCNNAHFKVYYHDKDGWELITTNLVKNFQPDNWNRLEISAREGHYSFVINNVEVHEMTDDRIIQRNLSIYLEVPDGESAEIWFDNFGYQSR